MATVRILKNILESKVDVLSVDEEITVEQIIRQNTSDNLYEGTFIECYDADTGKTSYIPLESEEPLNAIIQVNGKEAPLDYCIKKDDIVCIIITPSGDPAVWGGIGAALGFVVAGIVVVASALTGTAALLAIFNGIVGGFALGYGLSSFILNRGDETRENGLQSQKLPDVRGASNQPLTDQSYPFVLGKHLVTPFIVGSPWNEISGTRGQTNYIHCLYAVGYAPLRLTDFKLGEMYLAHNQRWNGNDELKNIFHGTLHGVDSETGSGEDRGDIVSTWANNDVTVEILQQGQNGETIDYGNVYPYAKIQEDIRANVLYIADGTLEDIDRGNNITYKGLGLQNGLRNNPVRFTEQYPRTIKVELNFGNGLYKTRSETHNKTSVVKYYKIPMWTAIQWRVYSENNDTTDGSVAGELAIPEYDYVNKTYVSQKRGWISFDTVNGTINKSTFTLADRNADIDAHTGNDLKRDGVYTDINEGWIGAEVFNLYSLGATNQDEEGVNEIRCVTSVDLIEWARQNLLTAEERENEDEEILVEKFKAYFFDGTNTAKSIEVRVVRVSPCYIDETVSNKDNSAFKFNDVFTWNTLTSEMIDGDELMINDNLVPLRPLTEERMRKLCIVSLKAKTDNIDQLSNTIKSFSCMAQAFAPYYDEEEKKWFPENVNKITKYYKPPVQIGPKEWREGQEITEGQFYADRQNGIKSIMAPSGNDFISNLVNNIIRTPSHIDEHNRYYIPYNDKEGGSYVTGCDGTLNYCTNNVASMFLLAGIGPIAGVDALGYEQSYYENGELKNNCGDFNMTALASWAEETKELVDGSFYPSDGYHYDYNGNYVQHHKGDEVKVFFAANAYIFSAETMETILAKIATAGRALFTRDNKNRLTVVMDKPEKYPVALINQQNALSSTYTISFADLPSGLQMDFPDETDGYETNSFYCMVDGESSDNPRKAIEQYQFPYVTNAYQQNSLGRYLLANRILNKEVVTKKIGMEGASINLGDLVLLQDDTMLIGTDSGGRITQIIESDNYIYGFIINNTFHYTGEEETYTDGNNEEQTRCVQGVVVLQPSKYKESRLLTLRLAKQNTSIDIDGKTYLLQKGNTNIVLFDQPISKDPNGGNYFVFQPQIENLVSFGKVGSITSTYRVIKIKPDNKHNYELTLSKYQEELYNYGRALPSFQNNMTIPDRSAEDSFPLSDTLKTSDLSKITSQAITQTQGVVDTIFGKTPAVPTQLNVDVNKDGLYLTCLVEPNDVNTIDYVLYEITKYRDNNGTIEERVVTVKDLYEANYLFDRSWEGYPEKNIGASSENNGTLDFWKIRAKTVSMYVDSEQHKIESNWSSYVNISSSSLLNYGTWHIPNITVTKEVLDRTVILSAVYTGSPQLEIYGTIATKIKIKRIGNLDCEETFNYTTVTELPENPSAGDIIHYMGEDISELQIEYGNYYRYTDYDAWIKTGRTFNEILGIDVDSQFYTPEFDASVQYSDTADNEPNYRKPSSTTPYVSSLYKITHTLPLLGQTPRVFKEGNIYTDTFTKDVTDYSSVPQNPSEGDIIHYIGSDITNFMHGGYYLYENNHWVQVYSKTLVVPTTYVYSFQMTNESGYLTNEYEAEVTALCTNIADIVHSHEHYKSLYVEKLSAISANIGLISQGGMGSFENMMNCWALSDLTAEDSGVLGGVLSGTFRVGDDKEYFRVTPYLDPSSPNGRRYKIELKAGNIELSTDVGGEESNMDFTNGTFVYNAERTARLRLSPEGIIVQKLVFIQVDPVGIENPKLLGWYEYNSETGAYVKTDDITVDPEKTYYTITWEVVSKMVIDIKGNMIISNAENTPDFGYQVAGTIYHFNDEQNPENEEVSEGSTAVNPENISVTGTVIPTNDDCIIFPTSSKLMVEGTVEKDISQFEGNIVFLSKSEEIRLGPDAVKIDGTIIHNLPDPLTGYNEAMRESSAISGFSGTVGAYLGLTQQQIDEGIFN